MKEHYLKVSTLTRSDGKSTPFLQISGLWLENAGYPIGSPVKVSMKTKGELTIELDPDREIRDAEKELRLAHKRFNEQFGRNPNLEEVRSC